MLAKRQFGGMESKPPAAWPSTKDSMSVILEFCKHLYTSNGEEGEERGSLKGVGEGEAGQALG